MADYVVTLTGKDNLSGTIKSVKQELNGVGGSAKQLDKISAKFDKITKSSMPLNRQVRETSKLLSEMKFDGDYNAAQFLRMAKEAGKAKDAIGDTQQIIKAFADDNFALNTVVQGVQGIAAAGSVATGTMALFGVESESAAVAIQKVQGALAILNGLQTIANVLNKDSYISIARKIIALKAEAVATDKATVAQTRLNLAVLANPYVAAAAAIAALAAGIYVLAKNSDDAAKEQEELRKETEMFKQAQDRENATLAENIVKFKTLQSQWNSLAGDLNAKKKFITDNKTEFENLGIKVNDVTSAESVFGKNANAIIAAMKARADAAAAYAMMVDVMKEKYAEFSEVERKVRNGESFKRDELKSLNVPDPDKDPRFKRQYSNWGLGSLWNDYNYTLVGEEAATDFLEGAERAIEEKGEKAIKPFDKMMSDSLEKANATPFYTTSGKSTTTPTKSTKSPKPTTPPKDDTKTVKGLIGQYEKVIEDYNNQIKEATDADTIKDLVSKRNKAMSDFFNFKVSVGLEVDPEIKNQEEAKKRLEEEFNEKVTDNFNKGIELQVAYSARPSVNANYGQSSYDKAVGNGIDRNSLDGIQTMMDYNDTLIEQMQSLASSYEQLGLTGSSAYQVIIEMLKKLKQEQSDLGEQAGGIVKTNEQAERTAKNFNYAMDAMNSFGEAMSTLGQVAKDEGLQVAGIVAQAIAQVALGFATASAQEGKKGIWFWLAASAAGLAQMMAMISQIKSVTGGYASGGIIGGTSYSGDKLLARVNSGEMVLNKRQQSNLFNAINSGNIGGGTVSTVEFKLRGADIYGSMKNYKAIKSKTGLKGL